MKFDFPPFLEPESAKRVISSFNPKVTNILWDLDETLVSHREFIFDRILRGLFKLHNYIMTSRDEECLTKRILQYGTDDVLNFTRENIFSDLNISRFIDFLREDKSFPAKFVRVGASNLLWNLKETFSMKICTNGNVIQQTGKVEYLTKEIGFDLVTFFCSSIAPKPSPLCLLRALGDCSPEHSLFIGDSEVDSLAADSAGVKFLNVSNLLLSREVMP